jgi:5-histidylcysteine sulfoxide synthase/putative 4-mercaptohistidine N1-methyltranferase
MIEDWRNNLTENDTFLKGARPSSWWTGKPPIAGICPGVNAAGVMHSLALLNLNTSTRQQVLDYFNDTWTLTELLFSALQGEEAFYIPPYHQLRHPLIFYYGHPTVLFINKLRVAGIISQPINPYLESLLETGVDEMNWDDLSKNQMIWPKVQEITDYRSKAYHIIREVIETHPDLNNFPITAESPLWALFLGFEHERIHLETSSVLIRELPLHLVRKPEAWPDYYPLQNSDRVAINKDRPLNKFINVNGGKVHLGKPKEWPTYGWDNEYGECTIDVPPFSASQYLISNGEFYDFVADGGYQEPRYWSDEAWKWRTFRNTKHPTFWVSEGPSGLHQYQLRLCFEVVPMQWSWPAEVNYYEAKAYCAWRTEQDKTSIPYRLTTEAEHHSLHTPLLVDPIMLENNDNPQQAQMNINLIYGSENAVDALMPNLMGFYDVFGNVWKWCEDHFAALPGFKTHYIYDDFSTPCFDGKHHLIMGGSFISTGDEASRWARYSFRPHFFQHAGFRLVQPLQQEEHLKTTCLDAPPPHVGAEPCCSLQKTKNVYETEQLLNQYLLLHYGNHEDTISHGFLPPEVIDFPKRCAQLLCEMTEKYNVSPNRALDVGCAVGGSSFELARLFLQVIGIDLSQSFIGTANQLKKDGEIIFSRKDEGELYSPIHINIDTTLNKNRVDFQVGDACSLPTTLGEFDAVLMANLLCRLPDPSACLKQMSGPHGTLRIGGLLLCVSPYSWLSAYTPQEAWLGGKKNQEQVISSIAGLHAVLDDNFELLEEKNVPFVIREHARKFEYIISHATLWRRSK